jgi:hypothetical protein
MASLIIPIDVPEDGYTLTFDAPLSGVQVFFDLRWREAASGWYLSAALADGTSLGVGIRLCPGSEVAVDLTIDGAPSGTLYCIGEQELTQRLRFGTSVFLSWVEA